MVSLMMFCVFQIWIKKEHNREIMEKEEPKGFKFVKKMKILIIHLEELGLMLVG